MIEPWENLLETARNVHLANSKLQDFCPFPKDIKKQEFLPFNIPAGDLMQNEIGFFSDNYIELRDAFIAAGPYAHWSQTYKGTTVGDKFLEKFGCYGLIGPESPFQSEEIRAWVVYMPKNFYYPWHQHPAEEMYLCLAGEAAFRKEGFPEVVLNSGGVMEHSTNQPHAMETFDHPIMAYVVWRNEFGTRPVLTYDDAR